MVGKKARVVVKALPAVPIAAFLVILQLDYPAFTPAYTRKLAALLWWHDQYSEVLNSSTATMSFVLVLGAIATSLICRTSISVKFDLVERAATLRLLLHGFSVTMACWLSDRGLSDSFTSDVKLLISYASPVLTSLASYFLSIPT